MNRRGGGAAEEDGGSNRRSRRRRIIVTSNNNKKKKRDDGWRRRWLMMVVCCGAVVVLYSSWNWNWNWNYGTTTNPTYQQILLTEHDKAGSSSHHRQFPNPVLAYVTPWSLPLLVHFQLLSLILVVIKYNGWNIGIQRDMKLQRTSTPNLHTFHLSGITSKAAAKALLLIIMFCKEHIMLIKPGFHNFDSTRILLWEMGFDGIVLESWSTWAAYGVLHDPHMRNAALRFIKKLGRAMHAVFVKRKYNEHKLQLVYVIGPPRSDRLQEYDFGPEDLQSLSDAVDGYSLMTYDFSNPQKPGPNAPLEWVHSTMQLLLGTQTDGSKKLAQKIFLGINFYGNDFVLQGGIGGGPILGRDYLSLLEKHKPQLQWDKKSAEHFFLYSDDENQHVVFYPSLLSIAMRLDEARSWGAGISIWEIGQGLDYFFDLL